MLQSIGVQRVKPNSVTEQQEKPQEQVKVKRDIAHKKEETSKKYH